MDHPVVAGGDDGAALLQTSEMAKALHDAGPAALVGAEAPVPTVEVDFAPAFTFSSFDAFGSVGGLGVSAPIDVIHGSSGGLRLIWEPSSGGIGAVDLSVPAPLADERLGGRLHPLTRTSTRDVIQDGDLRAGNRHRVRVEV